MTDIITLHMTVEVMGCPTVCQHCWAMGRGYSAMPLEDITRVLREVRRFCEGHGFAYGGFPMHEVDATPNPCDQNGAMWSRWSRSWMRSRRRVSGGASSANYRGSTPKPGMSRRH